MGSTQTRDWTCVSCIGRWILNHWATRAKYFNKNTCLIFIRGLYIVWASLVAQLAKNPPAMEDTLVQFLGWEDPLEKGQDTHSVFLGFPCGTAGKESTYNAGDLGSIPGLGRTSGEGKGYPLQYSGLENLMDCRVHGVAKSQTQLSNFHFHFIYSIHIYIDTCSNFFLCSPYY